MKTSILPPLFLAVFFPLFARAQKVLTVPSPYPTIQAAIDAAADSDTVLVSPGHYLENIDYKGKGITVKSTGGPWRTTIEGKQIGRVVHIRVNSPATLEGFTITNGKTAGGGIQARGTVTIRDNIITNNNDVEGAAIHVDDAVLIERNTISSNTCTGNWRGGAIYYSGSTGYPIIRENLIINNISLSDGGAIYSLGGSANILNNVISGNTALQDGGGLMAKYSSDTVVGNIFFKNTVGRNGGAIHTESIPEFVNNTLVDNSAGLNGGGFYMNSSTASLINNILWNNQAKGSGPEIWLGKSCPTCPPSTVSVACSVVKNGKSSIHVEAGSTLNWGAGMITADPRFADRTAGDLHLTFASPCLETGVNHNPPSTDFEGDPRIAASSIDIGADEFHPHLYEVGVPTPGGALRIKVIGQPNALVFWGFSHTLRTPPLVIPGAGPFHLGDPFHVIPLGLVPPPGVTVLPLTLPSTFPRPLAVPTQALIGLELSNLSVVNVR